MSHNDSDNISGYIVFDVTARLDPVGCAKITILRKSKRSCECEGIHAYVMYELVSKGSPNKVMSAFPRYGIIIKVGNTYWQKANKQSCKQENRLFILVGLIEKALIGMQDCL